MPTMTNRTPGKALSRWRWQLPMLVMAAAFGLIAAMASPIAASAHTAAAPQPAPDRLQPTVKEAVKHDSLASLANVKPDRAALLAAERGKVLPAHAVPHQVKAAEVKSGSARVQSQVVTDSMPSFGQNFEGVPNVTGVFPPDTQGDVGPNNYVQWVNLAFAIYSKQGDLQLGPLPGNALWQGFGGPCETFNNGLGGGDPVTMYDEAANRWFMSQLAYPGGAAGFHQCIAISQTGDPTGAWFRYDFLFSPDTLNDYPKFGIWPDAYYASSNEFLNGASFTGVTVQAYDRAAMLAGQDATVVSFHIGNSSGIYGNLLPSDAEGSALGLAPPAGAPDPFVMFDDDAFGFSPTDRLLMWDFHVDFDNPANSTFGNNGAPNRFIETAPFDSNLCNGSGNCIPQPGTSVGLDTLSDRLMYRASYRNYGDHQSIALSHSVDTNGADHAGVRWYQLNHTDTAGWTMGDQGTFAPDADNRWMPSAALDASGDLAVGYSVSSSTTFPSIRVAGRLAGDPAGELAQGEATMRAGTGSQTGQDIFGRGRWGDYSAMQVDPTDGCTFWYTNEYMQTTSPAGWQTRIGSFKFPSCTAGPHGDLTGTVTDSATGSPIAGATVSTPIATTTTDGQGHYSMTLPAGSYDVTYSGFGYQSETVNGVEVTDGGTTTQNVALDPAPSVTLDGTVTDGSGHGWPLYTRIDINGRPGGPIFTDPVTGHYSVRLPQGADYTITYTPQLPGYQTVTDTVTVDGSDVTHDVAAPVNANCTAPGYAFTLGERFNSGTQPAGWDVTDAIGNGETWAFNNPGNRANMTGGDGGFAVIDSDHFGSGHTQDSSLVSPTIDLSSSSAPLLNFNEDYLAWPQDTHVDVDVSTDGGTTWQNVFHNLASRRGPRVNSVPLPQAANEANVKVRWRYSSTFGFWWEIDNVAIGTCDPVPGGLVVGNVSDTNTGDAVNGATVVSDDNPSDKATSAATPDDPNNPDGFYTLFSSQTGTHSFTASKAKYASKTESVDVAADDATRQDFELGSAHLVISPTAVTSTQLLGTTATKTLSFHNDGTDPAHVKLSGCCSSFQIRGPSTGHFTWIERPGEEGVEVQGNSARSRVAFPSAARWQSDATSATDPQILVDTDDPVHPSPNTYVDQALKRLGLSYTAFYDANFTGFENALTGGQWDAVVFADDNFRPPATTLNAMNDYVNAGGKLIVDSWTVSTNPSPLWTTVGFQLSSVDSDPPDPVHWWQPDHPLFNSPESVPEFTQLQSGIYGTYGQRGDPLADFKALAGSTGAAQAGQAGLILGNDDRTLFKGFTDGQNDADLDGDGVRDDVELWENMISGIVAGFSVPWLAVNPTEIDVPVGGTVDVDVTLSATADVGVDQPGTNSAQLLVSSEQTPQTFNPIDVTMNVTPPKGWGKITGTVSGTSCNGDTSPLNGAQVQANGSDGYGRAMSTGSDGTYAFWAPAANNPFDLIASKDKFISQVKRTNVRANKTVTVDFNLQATNC